MWSVEDPGDKDRQSQHPFEEALQNCPATGEFGGIHGLAASRLKEDGWRKLLLKHSTA